MGKVKNAMLHLLGAAAGFLACCVVFVAVDWVVGLIGQIPILGNLIYYPSGAGWAKVVLPYLAAIPAGCACSSAICGHAQIFCGLIIGLYGCLLVFLLLTSSLGLGALLECGGVILFTYAMARKD